MIDYRQWPIKKLLVTSLKLDEQNPRLPGASSLISAQAKIIEYLIEKEGVFELAKGIATQGYLLNEDPIVCKEGSKYVVLEGNRRVAACKILINPDLINNRTKQKTIKDLLKNFDLNLIKTLNVRVASDRDAADVLIVNRHTDGSAIEKWDKTKQDRFFYNRVLGGESIDDLSKKFNLKKSIVRETLIRYNIYQELLELDLSDIEKKEVEDETKFSMTNIERVYKSKIGKEFLGLEFDNNGKPNYRLPKDEYRKRLKKITLDVVDNKLNSRTYGDDKQQTAYISELRKSKDFNFEIQLNAKYNPEYIPELNDDIDIKQESENEVKTKIVPVKKSPSNKLIPIECLWVTSVERIDRIFKELKSANLDSQFNSSAVLFRSYLDMLVYQFLMKNNGIQEILIEEQKKLDESNKKRFENVKAYISKLNYTGELNEKSLEKALMNSGGISKSWVPSLKQMLSYLSKSEKALPDVKLRQALAGYVKGNSQYLDHNDFNLLVHNEYFLQGPKAIKQTWDQLFPLLNYINQQLSS